MSVEVKRDYLDGRTVGPLMRKLLLLPWQPNDMSHLSYEQREDEDLFQSASVLVNNALIVISIGGLCEIDGMILFAGDHGYDDLCH